MTKVIEPTPSQAAIVLKNFFAEKGIEVPLNIVQQGLARSRGYSSFNAFVKAVPHRGTTPPAPETPAADFSAFEGYEYWSITGRVPFDDDDTAELIWAAPGQDASDIFKERLVPSSAFDDEDEDTDEDDDQSDEPEVYIITETLIGKVIGGKFVFEASEMPVKA